MGQRTKQAVKRRAKPHIAWVKAKHKRRIRTKSRGIHPAGKRRRERAARRHRR